MYDINLYNKSLGTQKKCNEIQANKYKFYKALPDFNLFMS